MSSTNTVHPATLSTFAPTGCELSTWAYITTKRPPTNRSHADTGTGTAAVNDDIMMLPNLVTAHSTCLKIHVVDPNSGTLILAASYENLAGTIVSLEVIPSSTGNTSGDTFDGLLLGFAGHPRMSIVYPGGDLNDLLVKQEGGADDDGLQSCWSGNLIASSILDLTPALIENSRGSVSCLEQDLSCSISSFTSQKNPTAAVILGGGVTVAMFQIPKSNSSSNTSWWRVASDPYFLPLTQLSKSLQTTQKSASSTAASSSQSNKYSKSINNSALGGKVSHGFGDILSCAFLNGYTEPVIVLLHTNPYRQGGRACPGRLGLGDDSTSSRNTLSLTAVSVSIDQKRSVVLWTLRDAMPSDAFQLYQHPKDGVLVVCVNEILYVNCSGKIECCTAVNGWVRSTVSSILNPKNGTGPGIMQPNPSPLRKLSIQLDGSRLVFVNDVTALVSLRNGTLYSLELHEKDSTMHSLHDVDRMCLSLSPVGKRLGGLGMISTLSAMILPVSNHYAEFLDKESEIKNAKKEEFESEVKTEVKDSQESDIESKKKLAIGFVFAGSRMGDSTLAMYGLKSQVKLISLKGSEEDEQGLLKRKKDQNDNIDNMKKQKNEGDEIVAKVSDDENDQGEMTEDELLREEEKLYAPISSEEGITISHEVKKKKEMLLPKMYQKHLYRPLIFCLSMFKHIKVLDSLTGLGPLAPGCEGPIACELDNGNNNSVVSSEIDMGPKMNIHPCGFGSSGGLAILTAPGLNYGSTIISEADCKGIGAVYHCPKLGYVFLSKKEVNCGCMVLQLEKNPQKEMSLIEVNKQVILSSSPDGDTPMENEPPNFYNLNDVLTRMSIHSIKEFEIKDEPKVMIISQSGSAYAITILEKTEDGSLFNAYTHLVGECDDDESVLERGEMIQVSIGEDIDRKERIMRNGLCFTSVWSNGCASVFSINQDKDKWQIKEAILNSFSDNGDSSCTPESEQIVSSDIFYLADNVFTNDTDEAIPDQQAPVDKGSTDWKYFDDDDFEMYGEDFLNHRQDLDSVDKTQADYECSNLPPSRYNSLGGYISAAGLSDSQSCIIAICFRSGEMKLFDFTKLFGKESSLVSQTTKRMEQDALMWHCDGCGYGLSQLLCAPKSLSRISTDNQTFAREIKFFFCGPSSNNESDQPHQKDLSILRSFCLLLETNQGDFHLYSCTRMKGIDTVGFRRIPLRMVTRPSKEVDRHRKKLRRKGMINIQEDKESLFQPQNLHRFHALSGQDGLFCASARPLWIVSERGVPSVLSHRLRHSAPAGGTELPVGGFCSGLPVTNDNSNKVGFLTIHERIGKVGSQRMTFFSGLSDIFTPFGLLPGGGQFIQKVPLGVTVRQIQYINDPLVSTSSHPLYALLISREVDTDQSHLNDDGMTPAEREAITRGKEEERMQKQVEADLGGFEIEQEWVEEIERDNCFNIEKRYGGAPPIPTKTFEIWLVDGSDWQMVDTFQLDQFEHGMAMQVMKLSDISEEEDSKSKDSVMENPTFLVVGTGIVDHDGEDVSSRGRILLFDVTKTSENTDSVKAELTFVYDKDISIGPVTCLNNLTCENKSRLVVGAGAEITIEQWGNGKLLQVGFFHANMHVQDVVLFKTFFLLSDAYDSLHFLVWRESDKSLTLLAKDYEPTCLYAAGIMSRGGALSFVVQDDRQNLSFYSYSPNEAAARGGNKLVCRADHHIGEQTTGFRNHFCRSSLTVCSATLQSTMVALKQQEPFYGKMDDDQKFGIHYGSSDGSIGCIIPVNEDIYWRLTALQSVMSNALQSDCSLSQRSWRLFRRTVRRGGCRNKSRMKGVIDCDLVVKFADLNNHDQENLASAIGSTVELIMDNLLEVTCSSMIV